MAVYQNMDMDETIVALATPSGTSAIGVIRMSGKEAITICNSVFQGKDLPQQATHTIHYGKIANDEGKILDEVVVSLFKAPKSYTKENTVEISCHGSPYIHQQVIQLLVSKGARTAKPGEFTLRAFMNGQMDLSQAEAVADLINSNSGASHEIAMEQMRGGFSQKIKELRDRLIHFASMIELELDFSQEDVEFADKNELKELVQDLLDLMQKLADSFSLGNVLKNGVATVIAGRPNAGKSTLMNRLLNEERAIVSDIPGTTRDVIEEAISLEGITFRFIDTAGIREASDKIESIGVERTYEQMEQATLVVYVFDVNEVSPATLKNDIEELNVEGATLILVGNKIDQNDEEELKQQFQDFEDVLWISAAKGTHVEQLRKALVQQVQTRDMDQESVIVTNARHYEALTKARDSLKDVLQGIDDEVPGDLLALDIQHALHFLGEITGEVTTDDILEDIFSNFCIGK